MSRIHGTAIAILAFAVMGGLASPTPALAQAPLLEGPERSRPAIPEASPDPAPPKAGSRVLPRVEIPEEDGGPALSGRPLAIQAFEFIGNEVFSDEELAGVVAPYLGERKRYSDLLAARDRVTRAYVDSGYVSSGAVLPAQDLSRGVITLEIVEGRLTDIEVQSDGRLHPDYLAKRLLRNQGAVRLQDLRTRLRYLKRDPMIEAISAELVPTDNRGEALLAVRVAEAPRVHTRTTFDNYAPPAIGAYRGRAFGQYRNLSRRGDQLSLAYTGGEGLQDLDVRLSVPVSPADTTVDLRGRVAWSKIVDDSVPGFLEIQSRTQAVGVTLRQPVLRDPSGEVGVFASVDYKRGKNFDSTQSGLFFDAISTTTSVRGGADFWWRQRDRAIAGRATLAGGTATLDRAGPEGGFATGLVQLQYIEYLPWWDLRVHARFDGQLASGVLPGLERIAAGGHGSVRGYRESLLVRDQAAITSLELRVPLPTVGPLKRLEIGVFSDFARARDRRGGAGETGKRNDTLVSAGLGLHAEITRYVSLQFQWAAPLTTPKAEQSRDLQDDGVHFALHARFP